MAQSRRASRESVELYLQNNPDFAKEWFTKNVEATKLDEWVAKDNVSNSDPPIKIQRTSVVERNSLASTMFQNFLEGKRHQTVRKKRSELLELEEKELFMELIRDIANELDVNVLCHKILLNVSILTKSDRGSLFLVQGSRDNKYLVSKLFDVTQSSNMEDCLHTEETEIRVPFGKGIAGAVAQTKNTINIKDAYEDPRFNKEVDIQTGYRTKSILCMPIFNYEEEVVGVAQIMNKTEGGGEEFTTDDEKLFRNYLTFCGIGLTNAQLFEMSVQEYRRNQLLLRLARGIFEEQAQMEKLVQKIMLEAHGLLNCQRCTVYILLDTSEFDGDNFLFKGIMKNIHAQALESSLKYNEEKELQTKHYSALKSLKDDDRDISEQEEIVFSKVFEMREDSNGEITTPSMKEIQDSKAAQLARRVAKSGEVLNIADCFSDPNLREVIVDYDGLRIRNMLSVPIRNISGTVIGVVQFVNKSHRHAKCFTETDINVVEAFAIFYGMGIHNCQMYEEACKLMAKQTVALEVLSYHATAPQEDVDKLKDEKIPPGQDLGLYSFSFNDLNISDVETVQATIRMFIDLNVLKDYHVPYEVLCRWTLSVKKNYRPVIYHNWRHAFNVAQTMFTMFYEGGMNRFLNTRDIFGLIVACLCHDLDHRGTNNAFQAKVESPIAQLYSTSTMEHHHFDQCIMILNSEGNNIFMHLSPEDYKTLIKLVEIAILSTDLALYFKKRGAFQQLIDAGEKEWKDPYKKDLLRGMMMTACDVAAITKPWEVQKQVAHLVASEFFEQGDIERSKLKQEPMAMMDRQKEDELPKMQVGFIDAICLPIYQMLEHIESGLSPLLEGCQHNRDNWQQLAAHEKREMEQAAKGQTTKLSENEDKVTASSPSRVSSGQTTSGKKQAEVPPTIRKEPTPSPEKSVPSKTSPKEPDLKSPGSKTCAIL